MLKINWNKFLFELINCYLSFIICISQMVAHLHFPVADMNYLHLEYIENK